MRDVGAFAQNVEKRSRYHHRSRKRGKAPHLMTPNPKRHFPPRPLVARPLPATYPPRRPECRRPLAIVAD